MHSGVRAAESEERRKLVRREEVDATTTEFRPLLRWADVWAIHKRHGIPPNPLYAMGAKRVGCLPCVMSRKAEIANIATRWPERIGQLRSAENHPAFSGFSSFFPRRTVPISYRSKKITTADGRQMVVCTIDDVVEWATAPTIADMQQQRLQLELDTSREDKSACQSTWGSCE